MKSESEKHIVDKFLQTRSEHYFRQLYRLHARALFHLVWKLSGGDSATAEDIIQEMWVRAVGQLHRFQWRSTLKTWLSGIAINCCREYNRKQFVSTVAIEQLEDSLSSIEQGNDSKIDIQKALSALPHGYREVLVLHDLEGYKHEEIGELLGISEGTSKSQLFNARKAMKKLLM